MRVEALAVLIIVAAGQAVADEPQADAAARRSECYRAVHGYQFGRTSTLEEARRAVECERALCTGGHAIACWDLATWTATGIDGIIAADLAAARALARRTCELGGPCQLLEDLSFPAPTPAEEDDVREAVFRPHIPADRPRNVTERSPVYCLAFGTAADPAGKDPPAAFMARFRDIEDVKPRSWCVQHRTGNRLAVGPVDGAPRPHTRGRVARTWLLLQWFQGGGVSWMVEARQEDGAWSAPDHPTGGSSTAPAFPRADFTEDRRRIAAVAAAVAAAWNRRDFDALARLHGESPYPQVVSDNLRREHQPQMDGTRLDPRTCGIDFPEDYGLTASASLPLRSTSTSASDAADPWKRRGAVSTVKLIFRKTTSWWEPGEWTVTWVWTPWTKINREFLAPGQDPLSDPRCR